MGRKLHGFQRVLQNLQEISQIDEMADMRDRHLIMS